MSGLNGPLLTAQEIAAVRRPFRAASLLPARAYHDDAIWQFEREQWFFGDWVCVGRDEDVPAPGTYRRLDYQGEDILLVRARDGMLRAFYNVCRHRGTCVVEPPSGTAVRFQCPYHAWIYDLDGSLVRAKHTEDLDDFRFEDFGLTPIRLEVWQGFVFLCFSEQTAPLETYMGDWYEHHRGFGRDYATLRRAARLEYDVAANWKIVAENYSECYHCPGVHPLLNQLTPYDQGEDFFPAGPWKGGWMRFADGFQTMSMDGDRHGRPLLPHTTAIDARRIYYYILWPNLIVSIHPDYVLTHQAWPDGPERTRVTCDLYVHANDRGSVAVDDAIEFWDLTNRQDYHVVELQQRGTRSRSWVAGRFSNQEAAVHAFDLMVVDRYAQDGRHTQREANTQVERQAGPARGRRSAEPDPAAAT
ncbi:MAG TPA: aromatic ring-hydroxylating dioxygenase subunit alpha [Candidatus Sulfotelmatobacter sp.]|nr:aromatic ring-hydroxylating dioxygenase subunit alpha [Candidatus Sulfotelmatobacter sp.]